jgi:hypothetical protein
LKGISGIAVEVRISPRAWFALRSSGKTTIRADHDEANRVGLLAFRRHPAEGRAAWLKIGIWL